MHDYLNLCVLFKYDLDKMVPLVTTTFTLDELDVFVKARYDINDAQSILSKNQVEHFNKIIDFLATSNYPLIKYRSIHIVGSTVEKNTYYVQLNNTLFIEQNNTEKNYHIYINYKPAIFDNKYNSQITIPTVNKSTFGKTRSPKTNIFSIIFKILTIINCFLYVTLYAAKKNQNLSKELIQHPFKTSWRIILNGFLYAFLGGYVSNFFPYYSNFIFNGLMTYVNFQLCKINCKTKGNLFYILDSRLIYKILNPPQINN